MGFGSIFRKSKNQHSETVNPQPKQPTQPKQPETGMINGRTVKSGVTKEQVKAAIDERIEFLKDQEARQAEIDARKAAAQQRLGAAQQRLGAAEQKMAAAEQKMEEGKRLKESADAALADYNGIQNELAQLQAQLEEVRRKKAAKAAGVGQTLVSQN